jgi:hypothetical protein
LRRLCSLLGLEAVDTVAEAMVALTWVVAIWEAVVVASMEAADTVAFTVEELAETMVALFRSSSAAFARTDC